MTEENKINEADYKPVDKITEADFKELSEDEKKKIWEAENFFPDKKKNKQK